MKIIHTVRELRTALHTEFLEGKSIGFVPTMGALHQGHGSLVRKSVSENDVTVVSIFVNPTQFGPREDLDKYPRTLDADSQLVGEIGADYVFAPAVEEMYPTPTNEITFVIESLDNNLCGAKRKGHFNGVLLVVNKLFNMVQPTRAYFGLKDYQQFAVLRRMVNELLIPVEMRGCPIIREKDGLAMSSRNRYLSQEERKQGLFLSYALKRVKELAKETGDVAEISAWVNQQIRAYDKLKLDYFEIVHPDTLEKLTTFTSEDRPVALIAAYSGTTRLIDNMRIFD